MTPKNSHTPRLLVQAAFIGLMANVCLNSYTFASTGSKKSIRTCSMYSANELNRRAYPYRHAIHKASRDTGVSEALIKAVITAESCFRVRARSHKGAAGLMQLMPKTAHRFGTRNRYHIYSNIRAGSRYLRFLLKRYRGNIRKAVAAYNAGEGNVDRYGGIPPFKETRNYVRQVMHAHYKLKNSKKYYPLSKKKRTNIKHNSPLSRNVIQYVLNKKPLTKKQHTNKKNTLPLDYLIKQWAAKEQKNKIKKQTATLKKTSQNKPVRYVNAKQYHLDLHAIKKLMH